MSFVVELETPFSPERLAKLCNGYARADGFVQCPCGQAAFVCPFFIRYCRTKIERRCGDITAEDWLSVLRGG